MIFKDMKDKSIIETILSILFFISLYMVELGPFSSQAVAKYNGGYGTFDMKTYNPSVVRKVLSGMSLEGISAEYKYYICDFIFIVILFIFQYLICRRFLNKQLFFIANIVAIVRGIADAVEDILLIVTIHSYPNINDSLVNVSSLITQIKLKCVAVWSIIFIIGIIIALYKILKCRF